MRTLIKFHVGSCKSTKEAVNVALSLGYIFGDIPQTEIPEKNLKVKQNYSGEENGNVKGIADRDNSI